MTSCQPDNITCTAAEPNGFKNMVIYYFNNLQLLVFFSTTFYRNISVFWKEMFPFMCEASPSWSWLSQRCFSVASGLALSSWRCLTSYSHPFSDESRDILTRQLWGSHELFSSIINPYWMNWHKIYWNITFCLGSSFCQNILSCYNQIPAKLMTDSSASAVFYV